MIVGLPATAAPVRLRDIAEIEDGLSDYRQLARFNGQPAVGLGIGQDAEHQHRRDHRPRVMDRHRERHPAAAAAGHEAAHRAERQACSSARCIGGAERTTCSRAPCSPRWSCWLFLRSVRSTLIIASRIPVSLLGAIAVMYFFGYTLQLGDAARAAAADRGGGGRLRSWCWRTSSATARRTATRPRSSAAMTGSREVTFAVIAATLSLVAIFAPVIFIGGMLGQFFTLVRGGGDLRRAGFAVRLADAHADAVLALPARADKHGAGAPLARPVLRRPRRACIDGCSGFRSVIAGRCSPRRCWCRSRSVHFYKNIATELAPAQDEGRFLIGSVRRSAPRSTTPRRGCARSRTS